MVCQADDKIEIIVLSVGLTYILFGMIYTCKQQVL